MALSVNGGFGSKGGGSNPNLLDNGWFTVNQRGATSYPNTSSTGYCVDRWRRHARVEVGVEADGISANLVSGGANGLSQIFENNLKIGDTVTVSVLMQNGTIYKGSGVLGDNGITGIIDNEYMKVNVRLNTFFIDFNIVDNILHIRAIKLEYGSTSTLALDSEPNYTTELLKCQRYFYKFDTVGANGIAYSNTALRADIKLPVPMRTTPTATITNSGVYKSGSWLSTTTALYVLNESHDIVSFTVTGSGFTTGYAYPVRGDYSLSADL